MQQAYKEHIEQAGYDYLVPRSPSVKSGSQPASPASPQQTLPQQTSPRSETTGVRTYYSMAVGNDEGLELNGTDDEERFEGGNEETKGRQRQGGINVVVVDKRIVWGLFRSNSEALYTNTGWSVCNFRGGIIYKGRCPIADLYCGLRNPCCGLRAQCCAAFTADCA